ncbi:proteasomal ubiquitin receptor ADRM1-like protein [Achlya hypogyna]|uniref:Proteasomal ubiquitin receptor ADRM1-like protein n=1 Tax=Achlya hypogyna TaxID=1202772 RepID=A0A1V9ZRV2_ACHHY|nr:proteasomal ubiquitin receptor ADRM1-like protein [Achlya hypogyna]
MFPAFGTTGGARAALVEFNAGKMTAAPKEAGGTKLVVTPDLQKGKIQLVRGDDQLLHFQWKSRTTGVVADDFIIFPNDAAFQKVDTGRPNDRVYVLQYKGSSRRFFFWMQNKDGTKDADQAKKVDELMNTPHTAATSSGPTRRGAETNAPLDHNAIMQMLGALGGGSDDGHGSSAVQMAELQQILQHMGMPPASSTGASGNPSTASAVSSPAPSAVPTSPHEEDDEDDDEDVNMEDMTEEELLRLAIEESMRDVQDDSTPDAEVPPPAASPAIQLADLQRAMAAALNVQPPTASRPVSITRLLQQPAVVNVLQDPLVQAQLLPLLPETLQTPEELVATAHTPQLRQCVGALSHALNSSNFNGILSNFGLNAAAGHAQLMRGDGAFGSRHGESSGVGIGAFLAAVQAWGDANKST